MNFVGLVLVFYTDYGHYNAVANIDQTVIRKMFTLYCMEILSNLM